jgi:hypothetical protein
MKKVKLVLIGLLFFVSTTHAYVFKFVNFTGKELKVQIQLSADTKTYETTVAAKQEAEFKFEPFKVDFEHAIRAGFCMGSISIMKNGVWQKVNVYFVHGNTIDGNNVRAVLYPMLQRATNLYELAKNKASAIAVIQKTVRDSKKNFYTLSNVADAQQKLDAMQSFSMEQLSKILPITLVPLLFGSLVICQSQTFTILEDVDGYCALV